MGWRLASILASPLPWPSFCESFSIPAHSGILARHLPPKCVDHADIVLVGVRAPNQAIRPGSIIEWVIHMNQPALSRDGFNSKGPTVQRPYQLQDERIIHHLGVLDLIMAV